MIEGFVTTRQLVKLAKVTHRQLQWWDERNVIRPIIIKHERHYSPTQANQVVMLAKLRKAGVSLQQCRRLFLHHADKIDAIVAAVTLLRSLHVRY